MVTNQAQWSQKSPRFAELNLCSCILDDVTASLFFQKNGTNLRVLDLGRQPQCLYNVLDPKCGRRGLGLGGSYVFMSLIQVAHCLLQASFASVV